MTVTSVAPYRDNY